MLVIYHHMPKAAGTALRRIIEENNNSQEFEFCYEWESSQEHALDPKAYEMYLSKLPVGRKKTIKVIGCHTAAGFLSVLGASEAVAFTMLRSPVERVLSLYYFVKSRPAHPLKKIVDKFSLEEIYTESFINDASNFNESRYVLPFFNGQLRSVVWPYFDEERLIELANPKSESNKEILDLGARLLHERYYVGIQEQFDESIHYLCHKLSWKPVAINVVNKTQGRPRHSAVDDSLVAKIMEYNSLDVKLYETALAKFNQELSGIPSSSLKNLWTNLVSLKWLTAK